jgi:hypothetical protein
MSRGSEEDFEFSKQYEWVCRVLRPVEEFGLSAPGDLVKAQDERGMSAGDAVIRFVQKHRESKSGKATIGVTSSQETEGYVVEAKWDLSFDGLLSVGVQYKGSRDDWHEKSTRGQETGA